MHDQAALLCKKQGTKGRVFSLFFVAALLGAALALPGCPNPANEETFPPAVPETPTVTAGDRQLVVSWAAVEGATAYEVWHGTRDSTEGAQKFGDDASGVTTTITGLANGTTCYVWVKAKNAAGASGFSPSAS